MSLRYPNDNTKPCWERASDSIDAMRIQLTNGDAYVFPYIHLLYSHFTQSDDAHLLEIYYNNHTIKITGHNLHDLTIALQRNAIDWISVSSQTKLASTKSVVIQQIEVETLKG